MVSKSNVVKILTKYFPRFKDFLENEKKEIWGNDCGLSGELASFSHYLIELIEADSFEARKNTMSAFNFVEKLMNNDDDEIKDAAATCFLENLINAVAWERIPASSFVSFLGKESKGYCKAWDLFTESPTEGLWNEGEFEKRLKEKKQGRILCSRQH